MQLIEARKEKTRRTKGDAEADAIIYSAIRTALLDGKLPPGLKLQEPAIARALGSSRERVRGALRRLAHEGWLRLVPNQGAFVPEIGREEVEDATAARIVVELAGLTKVVRHNSPETITRLRAHLELEEEAAEAHRRAEQIALSSDFHRLLMELAGNRRLIRFHVELMQASQLFYALYAALELPRCGGPNEHPQIVDAIEAGQAARAARLLTNHLEETQRHLDFRARHSEFPGFAVVFGNADPADGR